MSTPRRHAAGEFGDVPAGGKGALARPGHDDGPDGRIGLQAVEQRQQPVDQRIVQRIELAWTVQRHKRNFVSGFDSHKLGHDTSICFADPGKLAGRLVSG